VKAVLFVGHGSRESKGNEQVIMMVENIKKQLEKDLLIETCFLELAAPDMDTGIARCVEQGATSVAVIPMMLFAASHSKLHIPFAIDEAKKKYPNVRFTYGRPIGIHEDMLAICQARLEEVMPIQSFESEGAAVVLLGRGSSDPDANSDLYKLSRLLSEKLAIRQIEPAYVAVTYPSLEERVKAFVALGAKKVIVLPYLLFTGVLINRLEKEMADLQELYPTIELSLASYLGFHRNLEKVFMERMEEALTDTVKMNCDTCQFRLKAIEGIDLHHHHHHHDHNHDHHDHEHHEHHHGHNHHHHESEKEKVSQ